MRFEEIPAGESRQMNGPWWGVRVLSAGPGSVLKIDSIVVPLSVLVSYPVAEGRPIDRLNATGPIVLAVADAPGEDLSAMSASPLPQSAAGPDGVLLASWSSYHGGAVAWVPVVIPARTRALMWLSRLRTYGMGGGLPALLVGAWEMTDHLGERWALGDTIADSPVVGETTIAYVGDTGAGFQEVITGDGLPLIPTVNKVRREQVFPAGSYLPTALPARLGIFDEQYADAWDVQVRAIGS